MKHEDDYWMNGDSNLSHSVCASKQGRQSRDDDTNWQPRRETTKNEGSSMHDDSCIGINYAHRFPKCSRSLHTLLGFSLCTSCQQFNCWSCTILFNFWPVREFLAEVHTAKMDVWGCLYRFRNSAYWWYLCSNTFSNIDAWIPIEVDFVPTVQRVLCLKTFEIRCFGFQSLPRDLWWDSAAQLMDSIAQLRCVVRELFAGLRISSLKPFRADLWELLVLVVFFIEQLLEVHELQVRFAKVHTGMIWKRLETVNILHGIASSMWELTYAELVDEKFVLAGGCKVMSDMWEFCVVIVRCEIHYWKNPSARTHTLCLNGVTSYCQT